MATPQRLRVAVVGGGLGGLAAARILREAHDVTIYERNSPETEEHGAAIGLGPNGSKMARAMGLSKESMRAVLSSGFRTFDQAGNMLRESRMDCAAAFGSDWWMVHRQDAKDALLEAATTSDPAVPGNPAKILYYSHVVGTDPELGRITLADGTSVDFDLVIGADGIHSKLRQAVVGTDHPEPTPANLSLYRFVVPRERLRSLLTEAPQQLRYDDGIFLSSFVATDGSNRNVVIYPCRDLTTINFACAVPDTYLKRQADESWAGEGDVQEMLEHFKDFPSWLHTVIGDLSFVKIYQLRDADPLPTYVKGKVALVGDAAHPMVPYQGQGTNQALEDAEGLKLLHQPGVTSAQVPNILKKWDAIRRPRASQVQLNSRIAAGKVSPETLVDRMKFNWTYDGILAAEGLN